MQLKAALSALIPLRLAAVMHLTTRMLLFNMFSSTQSLLWARSSQQ